MRSRCFLPWNAMCSVKNSFSFEATHARLATESTRYAKVLGNSEIGFPRCPASKGGGRSDGRVRLATASRAQPTHLDIDNKRDDRLRRTTAIDRKAITRL